MKKLLTYSFLAAAAASGLSFADTATTKPVGYVTETIKAGQFNLTGLTVQQPKAASGTLTGVTTGTVTDSSANFSTALTTGQTYVLKITSGVGAGSIQEITSWTNTELTTPNNLSAIGVATGATYQIRKAATLSDLFGATNTAGLLAGNINTADIVWVPTGGGNFAKFYYSPAVSFPVPAAAGWKNSSNGDATNAPIVYADSIFIQRRGATDLSLVISGEVETTAVSLVLEAGVFNYVGGVFPVGSTLGSSGLATQVQAGNINTADVVWMPDGLGSYLKYYYSPAVSFPVPAAAGWKNSSGGDATNVEIKSGVIVQRRGGTASVLLSPPTAYGNL